MVWLDEIKQVFRQNEGVLTAALGLACALVCMDGMRLNTVDGIYPVELSLVVRHLFAGVAALLVVFAYRSNASPHVLSKTWLRVNVVAVLMAVSLLFRYSQSLLTSTTPALEMAGKLLEEVFGVLLILAWAERIVPRGFKVSASCFGMAMVVFAALQTLLAFFQRVPSMFALVLLPLFSAMLFKMYLIGRPRDETAAFEPARSVETAAWPVDLRPPASLGLYFGILFVLVFVVGQLLRPSLDLQQQNMSSQLAIACGNALSGLLVLLIVSGSDKLKHQPRFSITLFFLAVFALTTLSFALQGRLDSLTVVFYLAITTVVQGLCSVLKWFAPYAALPARWTPMMVVAATHACNLLARTVSSANMLVAQNVPTWPMGLAIVVALLLVFALCAVFIMRTPDPALPASEPSAANPFDRAVAQAAQEFGLTGQECRVLALCAQGMNARAISQEMTVSLNTTKSHMRMLYAKLGVHSQQELIDLVAQKAAD